MVALITSFRQNVLPLEKAMSAAAKFEADRQRPSVQIHYDNEKMFKGNLRCSTM